MSSVRAVVACLLAAVLATSPVVVSIGGASPQARVTGPPTAPSETGRISDRAERTPNGADPAVVQTAVVSQLDPAGEVWVNLTFDVGADARSLVVFDDDRLDVISTNGFRMQSNGRWKWDGTTENPWLGARVEVNKTSERFGGYAWVDTGDWALVKPPRAFAYYSSNRNGWVISGTGAPAIRQRLSVEGEGTAGPAIAYLGAYESYSGNTSGSQFSIIVPNSSDGVPVQTALESLTRSADQLDVGEQRDVNVFVAPDPIRTGGLVGGHGNGTYDVWIAENESVGAPANIWIHEYVHTRQNVSLGPRMRWFREASASYYAGLLSVRQGLDGRAGFDQFVERLHREKNAAAVLTDRSSWPTPMAPYSKGQRALAALDAKIRIATDHDHTLMTVFRRMNEYGRTVKYADFTSIVANVSGTSLAQWLDTHVAGATRIEPPTDPFLYVSPNGTSDADGDSLSSSVERAASTHPFDVDTDGDGLTDGAETQNGSAPTLPDTDGDGYTDGEERRAGTDPVSPFSIPGLVGKRTEGNTTSSASNAPARLVRP